GDCSGGGTGDCNAVRRRNGTPHPALRFATCPPSPPRGEGFADGILRSVHVYEMERTVRIHRDFYQCQNEFFPVSSLRDGRTLEITSARCSSMLRCRRFRMPNAFTSSLITTR